VARLIPSFTDDRTPPGERDVFTMFAAGPDDWVILHSLDLAPFNRGVRTEVDFIALIPDTGIVCIEVKSHSDISFKNDCWYPPTIKRSPFKQATDGRYTFYRRLCELAPIYKDIPVVHLCIFPNARFDLLPNLSVQRWELMDEGVFRSFGSGEQFCADVKSRVQSGINSDKNLTPLKVRMSDDRIETIVGLSVPVQRWHPARRSEIERREHDAERVLREQQKPVLRLASLNRQIIVTGPAGTGKTLIALEVARRKAAHGARTGLFCFNRLVGKWMCEQIEKAQPGLPNLVVGPTIKMMAEMSGISIPDKPHADYWEHELPERLEERLTDPDFRAEAKFDYLIIDEAQDLLARPQIWNCLSQFLEGGFESGNYALFGDFENQVIEERPLMSKTLGELESSGRPTRWELSENCRNYPIVGDTAATLAGFGRSVYSGYLRTGGSVRNYDLHFYEDAPGQVEMLRAVLKDFRGQGYKTSEIVVLSFRAPEEAAAECLRKEGFPMRPLWSSEDQIGYGSIHAFKGMESKIVILTDLLLDDAEMHRTLFYVGMTRATETVRIFCDSRSKGVLGMWLAKGALHA
jgi:DNA polymerase III delta prime subunit